MRALFWLSLTSVLVASFVAPLHRASHVKTVNGTGIPKRVCGTGPPSVALLDAHVELNSNSLDKRATPKTSIFTVNTYFHVVSTEDQATVVSRDMIANQVGVLQAAYASSNISFKLVGTDYTINDSWATDVDDVDMKIALRRGNYSSLNVYFQTNLSTMAYGEPSQLLGYCTLPTNVTYSPCDRCDVAEFPASNYAMDGCNILAGSMPNGAVVGYNMGKTAVHEIGHWFGLLHTFQDNTCDLREGGDFIDDTPQQSVSTDGCPVGKDSCPGDPGLDAIHNFMDYSTDACYESFTPQQIVRMQNMYETLRFGN
ncbi:MAG: hypothetical protein MMC23_007573 [Stictis urceolatum]|nr:hypothetical protein [Stictis urceolata]